MAVKQRRRSKVEMVKILVTVDPVTKVAVKAVMEKGKPDLLDGDMPNGGYGWDAKEIRCRPSARFGGSKKLGSAWKKKGWHPGLSRDLARELLTGESEKLVSN